MWCSVANKVARLALIVALVIAGTCALADPLGGFRHRHRLTVDPQSTPDERALWLHLRPSILVLTEHSQPTSPIQRPVTPGDYLDRDRVEGAGVDRVVGSAVCIDASGLFLAHQNSVRGASPIGLRSDGRVIKLKVLTSDPTTDLVLLQVVGSTGDFRPVPFSDQNVEPLALNTDLSKESDPKAGLVWSPIEIAKDAPSRGTLLAVLPNGPVRAEIARADIVAAGKQTRQVVAVNEIHFAAPAQMLAGALLFDPTGKLVGLLGAVSGAQASSNYMALQEPERFNVAGRGGGFTRVPGGGARFSSFGPAALQIAFSISPVILSRVVHGFKSPDHQVKHPALGATCADALNANGISVGALVMQVTPDSAAAKSGLVPGDIIVLIDGAIVNNPIDYAWNMLNKEVGQSVRVTIRRGESVQELNMVVGLASPPANPSTQAGQKKTSTRPELHERS